MKKFSFCLLAFILLKSALIAQSADSSKVNWTFNAVKNNDTAYTLKITGKVEKGWRLFSTTMSDDQPNTRIAIDSSSASFASIGSIQEEGRLETIKEPVL